MSVSKKDYSVQSLLMWKFTALVGASGGEKYH